MLRLTAITAVGASRQALQAGLRQACPTSFVRGYASADASFSVSTPKASKRKGGKSNQHRSSRSSQHKAKQRSFPSPSSSYAPPRNKRILALGSPSSLDTQTYALEKAIDSQDVSAVWSIWQELDPPSRQLGRDGHHKLLRLCSAHTSDFHGTQAERWRERLTDFAQASVVTGDVDLICGWLKLLLANGQFDNVVGVWESLVRMRLDAGPSRPPPEEPSDQAAEEVESTEKFVRLDVSPSNERVEIHDLVCLVAFALTQTSRASTFAQLFDQIDFGSPFRLFFSLPRAKKLFESTLQAQKPDWSNTVQPMLWNIELARGLASGSGGPQRIARLLGSLFQGKKVDEAYAIFQTAMRADWLSFENPTQSNPSSGQGRAQWTESCWSVCLSNFIAYGRTDLAMEVWTHFQRRQTRPTPRIWNALLDGYGRAKNYTAALQTWATALKEALPDEQMYTTMINIHFRQKKIDEAMGLFSEMIGTSTRHGGKLDVQAETFNAVLHGLFLNGRHAQAQILLEEMLSKGPSPNIGTINTFLRAHARVGDLSALATTLRLADKLKLTPDVVTFTTILDALLRKGGESATDAVAKTLSIMTSMGVQPNVVTYTAMIKACLVGAEAAQLDIASQSMFGDSVGKRRSEMSSNDVRIEAALELLDRMVSAKVAPSEITYTALVGGCLQNPDAVAHAFQTKTVPRQYRGPPKFLQRLGETSQTVQRWTQESPDVSLALLLLEQMKSRGLSPTPITFHYLIEGLCSTRTDQAAFIRSMDLIDDMLLRCPISEPSRKLGPFAANVIEGKDVHPQTMHPPSHTTWIIIFSSLIDRLENGPRDQVAITICARALTTAIRLVREMGSLSGAEGGMSLSRLVERAASLTSRMPR